MRNFKGVVAAVLLVSGAMLFAGCGQKTEKAAVTPQARQMLVEGTVYLKQGDVVKAVQNFAAAIKMAPDYFDSYYMLGETFIHLKQFPQAQAVLTSAINRFPENPMAYYLLAVAYEGSGNMMPAIVSARKSIDLFQVKKDEDGVKRATILLGALVQIAKQQAETNMVNEVAQEPLKAAGDVATPDVK